MIADENWKPKCRYRQEDPIDLFYWRLAVWTILSVDNSTAKLEAGWARQARTGVGAGTLQTKDKYKSEQKEPKWVRKSCVSRAGTAESYPGTWRRWKNEPILSGGGRCGWWNVDELHVCWEPWGDPGNGPGHPGNGLKTGGKTDQEGRREGNMRRTRDILIL